MWIFERTITIGTFTKMDNIHCTQSNFILWNWTACSSMHQPVDDFGKSLRDSVTWCTNETKNPHAMEIEPARCIWMRERITRNGTVDSNGYGANLMLPRGSNPRQPLPNRDATTDRDAKRFKYWQFCKTVRLRSFSWSSHKPPTTNIEVGGSRLAEDPRLKRLGAGAN